MSKSASASSPSHFKPMGVDDVTFLVDRLGADCAPLQFVRELTENALAATRALSDRSGTVIWDVDWNHYELQGGAFKLAIIDNGVGMTGQEMVDYINNLSSSIHVQTKTGNYGVGAKIAAAPLNHEGLVYLSWKDGIGYMIQLYRHPELGYGLRQFEHPDGRSEYWCYVEDALKPESIGDNGTMVILLGMKSKQDTIRPPEGTSMPSRWIMRYLNSRYFKFPDGTNVSAREGWELPRDSKHNFLRAVTGMQAWLEVNSEASGQKRIKDANLRWWILREDVDRNSGHVIPNGHTAALYQNELYEVSTSRVATKMLQSFGIIFGHSRVVIYVEPDTDSAKELLPNTARTQLILDGAPLPWESWASEFSASLPPELERLVEETGAKAASTDHSQSIRDRLNAIRDLLKITRYRKAADGKIRIAEDQTVPGGTSRPRVDTPREPRPGPAEPGGPGGRAGDLYSLFQTSRGTPATEINADNDPTCKWISIADGTREYGDLEDRAARFLPEKNLILINGDFRLFSDMVQRWIKRLHGVPGCGAIVEQTVKEWFEQQLVEAVLGAQALRRSTEWTTDDLKKLWGEEALTAVVLPRYHVDNSVKRALGAKFGKFKERVA